MDYPLPAVVGRLIDEKLDIIRRVIAKVPPKDGFVLQTIHVAVLLYMPKLCLEAYVDNVDANTGFVLLDIENLVRRRFGDFKTCPPLEWPDTMKCHEYDNRVCIISGLGCSAPYNIIRFAPNTQLALQYPNRFDIIKNLLGFYYNPTDAVFPVALARLRKELQMPYSYWNMINMSPDLGQMWACGYFALKWIENEELFDNLFLRTGKSRIKLLFVWMPCNAHRVRSSALQLDETWQIPATELQHQWGREALPIVCTIPDCFGCEMTKTISAHNCETGRPILSGDTFYITRDTDDLILCRFVFDIQWAISCACAVSGMSLKEQVGKMSY